jgi:hypothetical protein
MGGRSFFALWPAAREPKARLDSSIGRERGEVLSLNQRELVMFYRKNLPGWERVMRTIGGVVMVAYGLLGMPRLLSMPGTMAGYLIAGTGAVAVLTGFFGFCPMCAMVGRRLPSP